MGWFDGTWWTTASGEGGGSSPTLPVISNAATAESIRDRVIALIESLEPSAPSSDRFRSYRNEGAGRFHEYCEGNAGVTFRRFRVRDTAEKATPDVSNCDFSTLPLTLEIVVAYPQNARTGPDGALDRDDAADADFHAIDFAVGIFGRANFSGSHDCTPLGCASPVRDVRNGVDYLTITARYQYRRALR